MIKRCSGCGVALQSSDASALGYTPDLSNKLCMRCFKMQHYNYKNAISLNISNEDIINKINKNKHLTFFIIDFLSISKEVLDTFKKINNKKILVINKIDVLPKSFKIEKIKKYLESYYDIPDKIIYLSAKNNMGVKKLISIMEENDVKTSYLVGYTNSGKSTIINSLTNNALTTSYLPNTTLDFINLKVEDMTFIDTPGLNLESPLYDLEDYKLLESISLNKYLKETTYQTKKDSIINILDKVSLKLNSENRVTIYASDKVKIERVFKDKLELPKEKIDIQDNTDIVIKGVCLINIKGACNLEIGLDNMSVIEVRPSLFS